MLIQVCKVSVSIQICIVPNYAYFTLWSNICIFLLMMNITCHAVPEILTWFPHSHHISSSLSGSIPLIFASFHPHFPLVWSSWLLPHYCVFEGQHPSKCHSIIQWWGESHEVYTVKCIKPVLGWLCMGKCINSCVHEPPFCNDLAWVLVGCDFVGGPFCWRMFY